MRFFFYGTLMDAEVRAAVLDALAPHVVEPARLTGWRRIPVAGAGFPTIVRDPAGLVEGVLARGLDHIACRRLTAYEGPEYALVDIAVSVGERSIAAMMFTTVGHSLKAGIGDWDFAAWQRRYKRETLAALARRLR
jgi:hypothetical protein